MKSIVEVKQFVNTQIEFHQRKVESYSRRAEQVPPNIKPQYVARVKAHTDLLNELRGALEVLEAAEARPLQSIAAPSKGLALTAEDIDGLPPELIQELSISETDMAEFAILSIVEEAGGVLSLDKILIALYKKTGEVSKRANVNARIYRMVQKGTMHSVPGRKGVYSTREISEEEATALS